jgi:hypothetical protein
MQGRSVTINTSKLEWVTERVQKQFKRLYRIDVDFINAFNAMNQAALWKIMQEYNVPEVDLLMNIYENSTVKIAPNDESCATIRFDTGVAQGSALSPLFVSDLYECTYGLDDREREEMEREPRN